MPRSPKRAPRPEPKHRAERRTLRALGGHLKRHLVVAAVAAAATVGTVATGVVMTDQAPSTNQAATLLSQATVDTGVDAEVLEQLEDSRQGNLSRSDRRTGRDREKVARLSQETESGGQATRTEDLASQDPRTIAQSLLPEFGFSSDQFSCLDALWTKESGWNVSADNPTSSAYGIPQALPGEKMASAGADWATNPATQIRWGLGYIAEVYGSPCSAWGHSQANNWY